MYESFFGLKEQAFNLTPDPDFLYFNSRTQEAFDEILYGVERREGFAAVIGDAGTGKTTLCCALLEKLERRENIFTVLIQNPMLSELDILRSILQDLGVAQRFGTAWKHDMTKKDLIDCLNTFLAERAREDSFTVLIIDESQNLSVEMLEQLRLLSNLETTKKKLLQIIFLGQPEFKKKLARLWQLKQRISVWFETRPLSRDDTEKYVGHRLGIAGERHRVQFGPGALGAIHEHSRGYPRLINLVCDRSLREAWKERSFVISREMVRKAAFSIAGTRSFLPGWNSKWMRVAAAAVLLAIAAVSLLFLSGKRRIAAEESLTTAPVSLVQPSSVTVAELQPAKVPEPPAPAIGAVEYILQVHSFRDATEAEEHAKELGEMQLSSFVEHRTSAGDAGWYAVYAGPFKDIETARRIDSEIRMATGAVPVLRERTVRQSK